MLLLRIVIVIGDGPERVRAEFQMTLLSFEGGGGTGKDDR